MGALDICCIEYRYHFGTGMEFAQPVHCDRFCELLYRITGYASYVFGLEVA